MDVSNIFAFSTAVLAMTPTPAVAKTAKSSSLSVTVENESFSAGFGSRRSVSAGFSFTTPKTTILINPTYGVRKVGALRAKSGGAGATIYQIWSPRASTRTQVFVSQNKPVFARIDLSQDFTVRARKSTAITVGARTSTFFGGERVHFASIGARQYFKGGSISYRLSLVDTNRRDAFFSHLINVALRDADGEGQTRLWLSAGEASFMRPLLGFDYRGKDLAAVLQRVQPLGRGIALNVTAGVATYARPGTNVRSTTFGLGLVKTFSANASSDKN